MNGEKIVITTNTTAQQLDEEIPAVFHAVPAQ